MRLIGMLDSPYVRRVAVSLKFMELPFIHEPMSVFRHFDDFASINPVVKAPTLVADDGTVLMDSSLILEHLERLEPERSLMPLDPGAHARAQRITGLALAACDKAVQIVYETTLRPAEKQHQPWIDRVRGQLLAACRLLEAEIGSAPGWLFDSRPLQPDISVAVAWRFVRGVLGDVVMRSDHPALTAFSDRIEALPQLLSTPAE